MADFNEREETVNLEPTHHDLDVAMLEILEKYRTRPERMPIDNRQALSWFTRLVDGQRHNEKAYKVKSPKSGKTAWVWPYMNRMTYLLTKFLLTTPDHQETIISASEDRIYWRGDDMGFFIQVINETERMRSMPIAQYRKQVIAEAKSKLKGMVNEYE